MCKKVDILLDTLENEIKSDSFDIDNVCKDLIQYKLNDENIYRIAVALFNSKRWIWLASLVIMILSFYVIVSGFLAFGFSVLLLALCTFLPTSLSTVITLVTLMLTISTLQCK